MPYPNEHSARLMDPDTPHIRVARTDGSGKAAVQGVKVPPSIKVVWYILRRESEEVPVAQALRFPKENWTAEKARAWLRDHEIKHKGFEAAGTEADIEDDPSVLDYFDALPTQRFTKDVLRIGHFLLGPDGKPRLRVTQTYLNGLVRSFKQMLADGHRVPVPAAHTRDPEKIRGYVTRLWRDGGVLKSEIEMRGEDAIRLARRVPTVSVAVAEKWTDEEGRTYAPALRHVAVVFTPAVSGQKEFEEIAADGGSSEGIMIYNAGMEDNRMDATILEGIQKLFELEAAPTEETILEVVTGQVKQLKEAGKKEIGDLKTEIEKLQAAVPQKRDLQPEVVEVMAKEATTRLQLLQSQGQINEEMAKAVAAQFVGEAGNRNIDALILTADGKGPSQFDRVVAILEKVPKLTLGGQLPSQYATLEDPAKKDQDEFGVDKPTQDEMVARGLGVSVAELAGKK